MELDELSFLDREFKAELGKQLNLRPCENGFMDLGEGVPVSDALALAMFFERRAAIPIKTTIGIFEALVSNIKRKEEGRQ